MAEKTTSTTPPDACHAAYTGAQCMYTQHPPQLVYMHREVLGHPAIQTDVSVPNACGLALQHAVPYACGFGLPHAVPYACDPGLQHAVPNPCGSGHPATNAGVLVPDFCGLGQPRNVMNLGGLGHGQYCPPPYQAGMQGVVLLQI